MGGLRSPRPLRFLSLVLSYITWSAGLAQEPTAPSEPARPVSLPAAHEQRIHGEYDRAIESYRALLDDPAKTSQAALGLAQCYLETGEYEECLKVLQDRPDDSANRQFQIAQVQERLGRYEEVLAATRAALKQKPEHAGARLLR